jgi:uncharacterized protein
MTKPDYRRAIAQYIREQAKPPDKFSHQPRLYDLATQLAGGKAFDDAVLYAAAWMHDLGVFIGHRPEQPAALARWDHLAYALKNTPGFLRECGFPVGKIPAVLEAIRTHMPAGQPVSFEAVLLRDADILEQLGAVGILRTVSKVGRDTRFVRFSDALAALQRNIESLPGQLKLPSARLLAQPRLALLRDFLQAARAERAGVEFEAAPACLV